MFTITLLFAVLYASEISGMKLVYFNIRGRAEAIRVILEDQGLPYTNDIMDRDRWINEAKPNGIKDGSLMFGQLPALVDPAYGTIVQSNAILRYLGRKLDIYGDDPTFTDMVLDGVEDWRSPYATLIYTEKLAAEALETYKEKVMQPLTADVGGKKGGLANQFDGILSRLDTPYLGGNAPGIADYSLYTVIENNLCIIPDLLTAGDSLKSWFSTMSARPKLSAYVESSPEFRVKVNGNGIGNCVIEEKSEL